MYKKYLKLSQIEEMDYSESKVQAKIFWKLMNCFMFKVISFLVIRTPLFVEI